MKRDKTPCFRVQVMKSEIKVEFTHNLILES